MIGLFFETESDYEVQVVFELTTSASITGLWQHTWLLWDLLHARYCDKPTGVHEEVQTAVVLSLQEVPGDSCALERE